MEKIRMERKKERKILVGGKRRKREREKRERRVVLCDALFLRAVFLIGVGFRVLRVENIHGCVFPKIARILMNSCSP